MNSLIFIVFYGDFLIPPFFKSRNKPRPAALPFGDNSFSTHSFTFLHFQVLDFFFIIFRQLPCLFFFRCIESLQKTFPK